MRCPRRKLGVESIQLFGWTGSFIFGTAFI
jgi:hypothetical protein